MMMQKEESLSERIIFRQDKEFKAGFWAADPARPESKEYRPIQGLHQVTPYGMLLISLAACTAQVVLIYAQHHGIKLDEVEFRMSYDRVYQEDCEDCENIDKYEEKVGEQIAFSGDLTEEEKQKLFQIAHYCPIEKILTQGIEVESSLDLTEGESHGI
jgi:uncharacterized OsmC-like protein